MFVYRVQVNDTPSLITEKLTGNSSRVRDLIIVNPQKKWITVSGLTTFDNLMLGELLNIPDLWNVNNNVGVSGPKFIGLGEPSVTDITKNAFSTEIFPIDKLSSAAARTQVIGLTEPAQALNRYNTALSAMANIAAGGSVSWNMVVGTAATIATVAGSPIAGAVVAAVGMAAEAFYNVLGDIIGILGGSTPIRSEPSDISMNCSIGRSIFNGNPLADKVIPYGFDDPAWWHIIDRNDMRPGNEQWDPRIKEISNVRISGMDIVGTYPNYNYFSFSGSLGMFWMFGVVFNEIYQIDEALRNPNLDQPTRTEFEFRKYLYSLLLRNWEARVNCNVNMNDRTLLAGAINLWNDIHEDTSTKRYEAIFPEPPGQYLVDAHNGYCSYVYTISGNTPDLDMEDLCGHGWSVTNIAWSKTKPFIEFMLTSTFDFQGRLAPIVVNTGRTVAEANSMRKFNRLIEKSHLINQQFLSEIEGTSTSKKILIGTVLTGAVAAGSLWYYSYVTQQTYTGAAKTVYKKTKNWFKKSTSKLGLKENPIDVPLLPPKPSPTSTSIIVRKNKSRRVAYRVDLSQDPNIETVRMLSDGSAMFYRKNVEIAKFRPTQYQLAKIRSGYGSLLIYTDQL